MNTDAVHEGIDRFLLDAFTALSWLAQLLGGGLAAAAAWLPADWHPLAKAAALLVGLLLAGRGGVWLARLPLRFGRRGIMAAWMRLRSPFGRADWAGLRALRKASMLRPGGLFLGQWRGLWRGADLFRHGEGHLLTIAGSGAGKTTGLVIPALLELKEGAVIVLDPKAQLGAMTARARRAAGEVFFLNPFAHDLSGLPGTRLPDHGFNPIAVLEEGYNLKDDAQNLARLLMVTDRADSGSYWNSEAAQIIAAFLVWMVLREPPERRTLSVLWAMLREDGQEMEQRLEWMARDRVPYLQAEGKKLAGLFETRPQWQGVIAKAQLALSNYAPATPLGDHTARAGFDLALLKRANCTVYIIIPTGRAKVAAPWLNMLMGVLAMAVAKPGPAWPVYMLMDEAPALGYLPDLRNHLRESREAGLRAWIFSQTRAALANPDLYGENGFDDIMGLCETKTFFGIAEPRLAREIADLLGERTAINPSRGDTAGQDRENLSMVGVPLMRAEDVLRLAPGRMILLRGGLRPVRAKLVPYWKRPAWAASVDPNPYRS